MSKVIIGIHGLGNKPPKPLLHKWWKSALCEGLRRIGSPRSAFGFELVYWANYLYTDPLLSSITDPENPLYLSDPYVPSTGETPKKPSSARKKFLDYIEKQIDKLLLNDDLSINFSGITDLIIHHFFRDLEIYYTTDISGQQNMARTAIQNELKNELLQNKHKDIMLLAHSMGSIIAYEAIQELQDEIKIHTFVTIGSPLGIPVIMNKIFAGLKVTMPEITTLKVPENIIYNWYNFSDLEDRVAINYNLADDYPPNSNNVSIEDFIVQNDYIYKDETNPHKSYGYLRTPEVAKIILNFVDSGKSRYRLWLERYLDWILRTVRWKS